MSFMKCDRCGHEFKDLDKNKYAKVKGDVVICPACAIWIKRNNKMTHREVFNTYMTIFGLSNDFFMSDNISWFPNGKNSIRVRRRPFEDIVFTYHNDKSWSLETVDMFIDRTSVKKKK